jgi:GNAT superfamily N-acetyltransferase
VALRALRFEEVADVLRLVSRSVEHGCRTHYDRNQRRAVYAAYATHLFVETLGPLETLVAEQAGRLVAMAQLDPREGRLRALFVDAANQGQGVGQLLLADVERRARERRLGILHGAMALNAVPFYTRAGFRPAAERVSLRSSTVDLPVLPMEKPLARIVPAGR